MPRQGVNTGLPPFRRLALDTARHLRHHRHLGANTGECLVALVRTVAYLGLEARSVEVQCQIAPGLPRFNLVGLPDKAVNESRERVVAALASMGLSLPPKRITINLSPADLPKEGSHYDLPIALALLGAMGVCDAEQLGDFFAVGELALDGRIVGTPGVLLAALHAAGLDAGLICPAAQGAEARWASGLALVAAPNLVSLLNHLKGVQVLPLPEPGAAEEPGFGPDLRQVKGQEVAKRALEIAAAGRHHLMMVGSPGSGKSMLAARLPGILPPLAAQEALETSMIHSLAGLLNEGGISRARPFREPHHTASMAAIVGGGKGAKPGEISLAHNGVLFMDEFPEFSRAVLETLRQPIETGEVVVARANAHIRYPCRFLLVAAANPCKCGYLTDPARACARVPLCGDDYLGRISGPLMDRFDLRVEVPPVAFTDLDLPASGDSSAIVAARVEAARARQNARFADHPRVRVNADMEGRLLDEVAAPDAEGRALLNRVAERFGLSARGYHRVMRVARTIADLDGTAEVRLPHIAEAVSFRLIAGAKAHG